MRYTEELLFLIVLRGLGVDGRVFTVKCSDGLSGLRVATAPAGTASPLSQLRGRYSKGQRLYPEVNVITFGHIGSDGKISLGCGAVW